MICNNNRHNNIEDLQEAQSWRIFRIISEFTEGFDQLSGLCDAISIFGSARLAPEPPYYQKTVELAELLAKNDFAIISGAGPALWKQQIKALTYKSSFPLALIYHFQKSNHPTPIKIYPWISAISLSAK